MNKRRLTLSAAAVAVMVGAGLAASASPASANRAQCQIVQRASDLYAEVMDVTLGRDFATWTDAYSRWLQAESDLEGLGC